MKPTFRIHFSAEHPNRPGLWLSRRNNFIGVLDVDQSDLDRDKRESNWLDGEWAAQLALVDRDLVPLDRKMVQEHLDKLITDANENTKKDCYWAPRVRDALQAVRLALTGSALEMPETALGQEEPHPVEETREPMRRETGDDQRVL